MPLRAAAATSTLLVRPVRVYSVCTRVTMIRAADGTPEASLSVSALAAICGCPLSLSLPLSLFLARSLVRSLAFVFPAHSLSLRQRAIAEYVDKRMRGLHARTPATQQAYATRTPATQHGRVSRARRQPLFLSPSSVVLYAPLRPRARSCSSPSPSYTWGSGAWPADDASCAAKRIRYYAA